MCGDTVIRQRLSPVSIYATSIGRSRDQRAFTFTLVLGQFLRFHIFLIRLILKSIDEYEANVIAMIFGAFDLMPFHICLVVYFRILGQNGLDHNTLNTCNHCKVRWVSVLLLSDIVYRFEHHFMISQLFVVVQTMASDTRMQWREVHFYQLDVQQINGKLCSVCVAHVNTLEDLHGLANAGMTVECLETPTRLLLNSTRTGDCSFMIGKQQSV